jgi:hypothetical protein
MRLANNPPKLKGMSSERRVLEGLGKLREAMWYAPTK